MSANVEFHDNHLAPLLEVVRDAKNCANEQRGREPGQGARADMFREIEYRIECAQRARKDSMESNAILKHSCDACKDLVKLVGGKWAARIAFGDGTTALAEVTPPACAKVKDIRDAVDAGALAKWLRSLATDNSHSQLLLKLDKAAADSVHRYGEWGPAASVLKALGDEVETPAAEEAPR